MILRVTTKIYLVSLDTQGLARSRNYLSAVSPSQAETRMAIVSCQLAARTVQNEGIPNLILIQGDAGVSQVEIHSFFHSYFDVRSLSNRYQFPSGNGQ